MRFQSEFTPEDLVEIAEAALKVGLEQQAEVVLSAAYDAADHIPHPNLDDVFVDVRQAALKSGRDVYLSIKQRKLLALLGFLLVTILLCVVHCRQDVIYTSAICSHTVAKAAWWHRLI